MDDLYFRRFPAANTLVAGWRRGRANGFGPATRDVFFDPNGSIRSSGPLQPVDLFMNGRVQIEATDGVGSRRTSRTPADDAVDTALRLARGAPK
jgi:hypothetical protein